MFCGRLFQETGPATQNAWVLGCWVLGMSIPKGIEIQQIMLTIVSVIVSTIIGHCSKTLIDRLRFWLIVGCLCNR